MDERCKFILEAQRDLGHFTELCARYGISAKTGYKWQGRHKEGGGWRAYKTEVERPIIIAMKYPKRPKRQFWKPVDFTQPGDQKNCEYCYSKSTATDPGQH
jgi:hypothetical protein